MMSGLDAVRFFKRKVIKDRSAVGDDVSLVPTQITFKTKGWNVDEM